MNLKSCLEIGFPSFAQLTVNGLSPVALHSIAILVTPGTTLTSCGVTVTPGGTAIRHEVV